MMSGGTADRLMHDRLNYEGVTNFWALPLPRTPLGPGTKGEVVGHALAGEQFYPPRTDGHCLGEKHHKGEEEWPLVLLTPIRRGVVFRLQGNCRDCQAANEHR